MKHGMEDCWIEGAAKALKHRKEFAGMIDEEKSWSKKDNYVLFKKQRSNPLLHPKASSTTPQKGPDNAAADAIVSALNKTTDVN